MSNLEKYANWGKSILDGIKNFMVSNPKSAVALGTTGGLAGGYGLGRKTNQSISDDLYNNFLGNMGDNMKANPDLLSEIFKADPNMATDILSKLKDRQAIIGAPTSFGKPPKPSTPVNAGPAPKLKKNPEM